MESFQVQNPVIAETLLLLMVIFSFFLGGSIIYSVLHKPEITPKKTQKAKKAFWFKHASSYGVWGWLHPVTWQGWALNIALLVGIIFLFRFHYTFYISLPIILLLSLLYHYIVHKKTD